VGHRIQRPIGVRRLARRHSRAGLSKWTRVPFHSEPTRPQNRHHNREHGSVSGMSSSTVIRHINNEYFYMLEQHFAQEQRVIRGHSFPDYSALAEFVLNEVAKPHLSSGVLISDPNLGSISGFAYRVSALLRDVVSFWGQQAAPLREEMRSSDSFSVLLNDRDWLHSPATARATSVYFDTLCIPDQLYTYGTTINEDSNHDFMSIHALMAFFTLVARKPLFVNTLERPIATLYPRTPDSEDTLRDAYDKTRLLVNDLFGLQHTEYGQTIDFFQDRTFDRLIGDLSQGPFHELAEAISLSAFHGCKVNGVENSLEAQVRLIVLGTRESAGFSPEETHSSIEGGVPLLVFLFRHVADLLQKIHVIHTLRADPFLDPLTWEVFKWQVGNNTKSFELLGITDEQVMIKLLMTERLSWLSNISTEELVKIREDGYMEDMREVFRLSRLQLKHASVQDFEEVADQLANHVEAALREHEERLAIERREEKAKLLKGLTSFSASVGLSVASLALPALLPLAITSALYSAVVGGKSVRDLINDHLSEKKIVADIAQRPIALLLRTKRDSRR